MTCYVAVCTLPICCQLWILRCTVCETENPGFVIPWPWKQALHVLISIVFCCREIKEEKNPKTLLAPMLRLVFWIANKKIWLNMLDCLLCWLLVSSIWVSKQATKEAECLCEANENQVKLHRMTWRIVTMKISEHCQLGISWYHIPSEGCSTSSVMEQEDGALSVELQEVQAVFGCVPIWVFLWREAGHTYNGCTVICSSDRAQLLGWSSQSRGSCSTESSIDDSLIQRKDFLSLWSLKATNTTWLQTNQLCKGTAENSAWLLRAWAFRW